MTAGVTFTELDASAEGLAALRRFYRVLYVREFPDPHERESLANMERYLELKARGWYGANSYHVMLMRQNGEVVGGSVFDYLAKPNAGVIEFLFTRPARRRRGLGRALLDATSRVLERDARSANGKPLRAIVAEMNDPFRPVETPDNMDPFQRAEIWGKWGFGRLEFPYVQPALSRRQQPVECLALMARLRGGAPMKVSADWVMDVIGEYMRWAMRIARPFDNAQYRDMARFARRHPEVALVPLERYVGRGCALPLRIEPIHAGHPHFRPALRMLEKEIAVAGRLASEAEFRRALQGRGYHLWSLRLPGARGPLGVASFFTLPRAGFGGYIVLGAKLRSKGVLRPLLARIEERMIKDAKHAHGWFIECDRRSMRPFVAVGFRKVEVDYRPPRVGAAGPEKPERLELLYKSFGWSPASGLTCSFVLACVADILRHVYGVRSPRQHACYRLARRSCRP